MDLVLWRHAEALDDDDDLARRLSATGLHQAALVAEWLNRRLAESTRIIVSPALRCQQTAAALGRKFSTVDALGPGADPATVLRVAGWPSGSAPVLVIGHQPTLGMAASLALTGTASARSIRKGAVCWLRPRADGDQNEVMVHAVQSPDWL
ncbi:MAG: histidine phosphatase family protein [Pseudomonadota bacterium]|nr:histidine phosphatase family protein [Pseudomonadota bacterium]